MEGSKSILEAIYEEDEQTLEGELEQDLEHAEMLDAETRDGEHGEHIPAADSMEGGDAMAVKQESQDNGRQRAKKNKKNKNGRLGSDIADINRFVVDTCRLLREKKHYLVWNAVGVLGALAVRDLVEEVDAIQHIGGQLTAGGKHMRTGGGILWNILKTHEPKAYKEIMARGKEFERQFRPQNVKHTTKGNGEDASVEVALHLMGLQGKFQGVLSLHQKQD